MRMPSVRRGVVMGHYGANNTREITTHALIYTPCSLIIIHSLQRITRQILSSSSATVVIPFIH